MEEEAKYITGFNEGYIIAKHLPELSQTLSKVKLESMRGVGFHDGRNQYLFEQTKNFQPHWLKDKNNPRSNRLNDKNRDRDVEPDL